MMDCDAHLVLDLSAGFQLHPRWRLALQARNLSDETYVAARRPTGARPGLPRTWMVGLTWDL